MNQRKAGAFIRDATKLRALCRDVRVLQRKTTIDNREAGSSVEALNRMLLTTAWSLVAVAVVIGAAIVTITVLAHRRQRRRGALPADQILRLQAEVMQFARARTKSQDMKVDLTSFWRSRQLDSAQRYVVLESLLRDKDLRARSSTDAAASGMTFLMAELLAWPTRYVSLSELEWNRLKNESAPRIHVRQGNGGIIQIGDHNTASSHQDLSRDFALRLVAALRQDASSAQAAESERANSLADSLEMDVKKNRLIGIAETVKTVLALVSSGASIWAASAKLFFE